MAAVVPLPKKRLKHTMQKQPTATRSNEPLVIGFFTQF